LALMASIFLYTLIVLLEVQNWNPVCSYSS